jgi:alkaline phosphatase
MIRRKKEMKKNMVRLATVGVVVASLCMTESVLARPRREVNGAKYIFFFLGDGLANAQIQATEAWLTTANGGSARNPADLLNPTNRLNMCKLPVQGMQTTFDDGALMTDSASSATAFACGIKTKSGTINKSTDLTTSYKSVAELAHEMGKSVGIVTSVSLDHATPAAYYAAVDSRGQMNDICMQLANSGYEFFGGGSMNRGSSPNDAWGQLSANGYSVVTGRAAILDLINNPQTKVVCPNYWLPDSAAMPYDIDFRNAPEASNNVSLAEMTQAAIACLQSDPDGFFIMVEGGKIDWAGHANDAGAVIGDVLDFDDAVGKAIEFYNAHPNETLIIVTGDHETGGMTVGHATTKYKEYYSNLQNQKCSSSYFGQVDWPAHKAANTNGYDWTRSDNLVSNNDMVSMMSNRFGLVWADLNEYQQQKLEDAYDKSMVGLNDNSGAENTFLYGPYEPIIVTITHVLNEQTSIGWTSYSHTGVPTPVYAAGFEAFRFAGFYDNTDIAKKIAMAMRYPGTLPITK